MTNISLFFAQKQALSRQEGALEMILSQEPYRRQKWTCPGWVWGGHGLVCSSNYWINLNYQLIWPMWLINWKHQTKFIVWIPMLHCIAFVDSKLTAFTFFIYCYRSFLKNLLSWHVYSMHLLHILSSLICNLSHGPFVDKVESSIAITATTEIHASKTTSKDQQNSYLYLSFGSPTSLQYHSRNERLDKTSPG